MTSVYDFKLMSLVTLFWKPVCNVAKIVYICSDIILSVFAKKYGLERVIIDTSAVLCYSIVTLP